jgi:hypothetical protein
VRYELLWQSATPGAPYPLEAVEAALSRREVVASPDGQRRWKLARTVVELGAVREGGVQVATELRLMLSDSADPPRELVTEATVLAREAGVTLFDPQLMRALSERDADAVAEQYLRTARWAGEMLGLPEAVAASYPAVESPGMSAGLKVLLIVIGVVLVALWSLDFLLAPPPPPLR